MADSSQQASTSPRGGSADHVIDLQGKQALTLTDKDLVVAYQSGQKAAYDAIYNRHRERVRRICYRMLGNTADAEEAVQETFLRTYRALGRFNGQYQLGAWVSRIASNVCLDQLRLRGRTIKTQNVDDEVLELASASKLPDHVVEQQIDVAESLKVIQPLHARALMLRAVAGLSHQEMASELQMTPEQVKSLLHRARTSFRRAWDQASGWALAPLGLRLPFARKQSAQAGDGLGMIAASPVTSTLLERVAASAVIAALALTGAGVVDAVQTETAVAQPSARPALPKQTKFEALTLKRKPVAQPQQPQQKVAQARAEEGAPTKPGPAEVGEAAVVAALKNLGVERPATPTDPGDDGEIDPATAGASAGNEVRRKVAEVVETAKKALKDTASLNQ